MSPRTLSRNPAFNLPILDPFPIPRITTALVKKDSPQEKLGLNVKSTESAVYISNIQADSPLATNANIVVGSEILAVNGQAVHNAKQATQLLGVYQRLELTTLRDDQRPAHPFCYVEVAPTSRINPGVSFAPCCNETMVMVGDGATDAQAKPPANAFIGFGGAIERQAVKEKADWFVTDFADMTKIVEQRD